jgi:hypothetical protein
MQIAITNTTILSETSYNCTTDITTRIVQFLTATLPHPISA